MSLRSPLGYIIPEETVRVANAAFPKGNCYMSMHAELGMLYTNPQFTQLFSSTGRPAQDPAQLALVLVWQFLEGLSDRCQSSAYTAQVVSAMLHNCRQ